MTVSVRLWLAALLSAVLVAACGGGSTVAGVGGGGTGIAGTGSGVVTGFGSIVVNGVRWDVRNAAIVTEVVPSQALEPTDAKLGQNIEIDFTTLGIATAIRIEPNVIGRVSQVTYGSSATLTVAGQTIRTNTDSESGPVTLLVGYFSIDDVQADDFVEVHGGMIFDNAAGQYAIQATRIEKRDTLPAGYVRVAGVLQSLSSGGFRLGGLNVQLASSMLIVPQSRELDNGYRVVVWGKETSTATPTLIATEMRIKDAPPTAGPAEVSGFVSRLDQFNQTFEVNGIVVDMTRTQVSGSLVNGAYVSVSGTYRSDGTLSASSVHVRLGDTSGAQIDITGSITDFVTLDRFLVRGVRINAASAILSGCGQTPLGYGQFVHVAANIVDNVVTASRVICLADVPADATLAYKGSAADVNLKSQTLLLTHTEIGDIEAQWTAKTLFNGVAPGTLADKFLAVEGYMQDGAFFLTKVELGTIAQAQAAAALTR